MNLENDVLSLTLGMLFIESIVEVSRVLYIQNWNSVIYYILYSR